MLLITVATFVREFRIIGGYNSWLTSYESDYKISLRSYVIIKLKNP